MGEDLLSGSRALQSLIQDATDLPPVSRSIHQIAEESAPETARASVLSGALDDEASSGALYVMLRAAQAFYAKGDGESAYILLFRTASLAMELGSRAKLQPAVARKVSKILGKSAETALTLLELYPLSSVLWPLVF